MGQQLSEQEIEFLQGVGLSANSNGTVWKDNNFAPSRKYRRWVGRIHHGDHYSETFSARTYPLPNQAPPYGAKHWRSPEFADPISAYVYAQSMNWGQ